MGGIAGLIGFRGDPESARQQVERMASALTPGRGAAKLFCAPGAVLAHSATEAPGLLGNEDGSLHLACDGEPYDTARTRLRLERNGHRFGTDSPAETILHLYEERGERAVDEVRGPFAFALWDSARGRLILARDRPGFRPLYYWARGGMIAFASELRALLALPQTSRILDRGAIADYLSLGYVPDPGCIYRGVSSLPPATLLLWDREGGVRTRSYWTPAQEEDGTIDAATAREEIRRLITESVGHQLESGRSIGAFLSGGIDSSTVAAEAMRQMDRPLTTFCIGFTESSFNEAPHAARIALALGTEHHEEIVRPDVESLFEAVLARFDEPFADASAIPTYLAAALARQHVSIALSGDGGDELFGGYTRYHDLLVRSRPALSPALRRVLRAFALRLPQRARGRNRLLELSRGIAGRYAGMIAHPLAPEEGGLADREIVAAGRSLDDLLDRWFELVPERDLLNRASLVDLLSYLPGDILVKVDRTSRAYDLRTRVPLLDHHLLEFAMRIPAPLKNRDGTGKWILREAIRDLVPPAVLEHPKKGFGVPLELWFRGPLRPRIEALTQRNRAIHEFVEIQAVRRLVREHLAGRRDHSALLWKAIVLEEWIRRSDAPSPAASGIEVTAWTA